MVHRFSLSLILIAFATPALSEVACEEFEEIIVISRNGKHVLTYQKTARAPKGVDPKYARSGFIHPITTPSGRIITDGYPLPHHSHQHGMFFAWKAAEFEGEKMNFWEPGKQSIRHAEVLEITNKGELAGFRVKLAHDSGEKTILHEIWTVNIHDSTGHIDFTSKQSCATKSPLTLTKYHYGGMALRGSRQWFSDARISAQKGAAKDEFIAPARMITDEGLTQDNGNHSRPKWVSMTGPVDGKSVSITMIPHPGNFRYPQHVRLHPKMPYFCFIPTVEEPFEIKPGIPWISRYRIIAADGEPDSKKIRNIQKKFAEEKFSN